VEKIGKKRGEKEESRLFFPYCSNSRGAKECKGREGEMHSTSEGGQGGVLKGERKGGGRRLDASFCSDAKKQIGGKKKKKRGEEGRCFAPIPGVDERTWGGGGGGKKDFGFHGSWLHREKGREKEKRNAGKGV